MIKLVLAGIGRGLVFISLYGALDWIDHMIQKFVLEIEPIQSQLGWMFVISGVIMWAIADAYDHE